MKVNAKRLLLLSFVALLIWALPGSVIAETRPGDFPWHVESCRYRSIYELRGNNDDVRTGLASGKLYARIDIHTGDRDRLDGHDIRAVDETGRDLLVRIGERGDDGFRTLYVRSGRSRYILIYYGDENAKKTSTQLFSDPPTLTGLTMSIYSSGRTLYNDVASLKRYLASARLHSRKFVDNVRMNKSPYGNANINFVAVYEGFFHAMWDGEYFFGTDSHGPSFIEVNGKVVARWPGQHWKQGSYVHGGKIRLRSGVYKFRYFYQKATKQVLAEAGWMGPGFPDPFLIQKELFVKYVPFEPVTAQMDGGKPDLNYEMTTRLNVSLNGGDRMQHLQYHAYGEPARNARWKLERISGDNHGYDIDLPATREGPRAEFFAPFDAKWEVNLEAEGARDIRIRPVPDETNLVLPIYFEASLDSIPSVIFRGEPFGLLVNIPDTGSFTTWIDTEAIWIKQGSPRRTLSRKLYMEQGYHLVTDVAFDPLRQDGFIIRGTPFANPRDDIVEAFYDSTFVFKLAANGVTFAKHSVAFLQPDEDMPAECTFDERGYLKRGDTTLIVVSEMEDDTSFRRWAPIKAISSLGERYESFLLIGDQYSEGSDGLISSTASFLEQAGASVQTNSCGVKPFPLYAYVVSSFPALDERNTDCVVLAPGLEDAHRRTPVASLEMLVQALADRARKRDVKKVVLLLPPVVDGYGPIMREYREKLSKVASRLKLEVMDLQPMLGDAFTRDGYSVRYPSSRDIKAAARKLAGSLYVE